MLGTIFYQAATLGLLALLTFAAVSDFRHFIIPNWIPISITGFYGLFVMAFVVTGQPAPPWIGALVLAFVVTIAATVLYSLGHLGGGDVKLLGAVSLWAGPDFIAEFLIATALAGGALALLYLATHRIHHRAGTDASASNVADDFKPSAKLKSPMPYGIAIAFGGFFTVSQLFGAAA